MPKITEHEFPFHSLLKLRENTRDEKRNALALTVGKRLALQQDLAAKVQKINETRLAWKSVQQAENLSMEGLRFESDRFDQLTEERKALESELAEIQEEEKRRRSELESAQQELKVLEKLRDRKEEESRMEQRRQETKLLDEINRQQDHRS